MALRCAPVVGPEAGMPSEVVPEGATAGLEPARTPVETDRPPGIHPSEHAPLTDPASRQSMVALYDAGSSQEPHTGFSIMPGGARVGSGPQAALRRSPTAVSQLPGLGPQRVSVRLGMVRRRLTDLRTSSQAISMCGRWQGDGVPTSRGILRLFADLEDVVERGLRGNAESGETGGRDDLTDLGGPRLGSERHPDVLGQ